MIVVERCKSLGGFIALGVIIVGAIILTLYFLGQGVTISPVLLVFLILALAVARLS